MAMLVSSFATPTSWAEVAASAEASLAQRELQKAATSTEKIVPEDFPKPPRLPPSSVPDNDLGPGQYTCTESLIRRTVSCARFGKAERFRKEREENVANSIANWADQLGSSLSAPGRSHPDSEAPFALSADDMAARREFLRQSRSRLRQSSQKRSHLSSQISRACLADMGPAVWPLADSLGVPGRSDVLCLLCRCSDRTAGSFARFASGRALSKWTTTNRSSSAAWLSDFIF